MEFEKVKNLKDLEFNEVLNKQNIVIVLLGSAIISLSLIERVPSTTILKKSEIILFLILTGLYFLFYFKNRLDHIKQEIKSL